MATDQKTLLLLLAATLQFLHAEQEACFSHQDHGLSCLNDFNNNITCVWNSTRVSENMDAACTISASRKQTSMKKHHQKYNASCSLEHADASRPGLQMCSLIFRHTHVFQSFHELSFNLSCQPLKKNLTPNLTYRPAFCVKMNPPGKPKVNFTTVSWSLQVPRNFKITQCNSHLQWKRDKQAWKDASGRRKDDQQCDMDGLVELNPDALVRGERYEVRVRIQANNDSGEFQSTWSDWSPVASWVSPIGTKQPPPTGGSAVLQLDMLMGTAAGATVALFMVIMLFRMDKNTWVYVAKKIRGPPLPNPAKFLRHDQNFQAWLKPQFTSESFHRMSLVDIAPIEVTSTVDTVAPCGMEAAQPETMGRESSSTSSSFFNPSYSHVCPPPGSSLQPCAPDAPYGPVGCRGDDANTGQDREEERGKDSEIQLLFSKGGESGESLRVSSDYERVEKIQIQRSRLQSPDSGVCSGEEVSQESLEEADSFSVADEWSEGKERSSKEDAFQTLLGRLNPAPALSRGSIQVCSDYESVEKVQADSPGLRSPDSGVNSGVEEQMSQESLEDADRSTESMSFLFPAACDTFPCFLLSFIPTPSNLSEPGPSPGPRALLPNHILEKILTSNTRTIAPSSDGYMPVQQEQS
ncbi:hypothetical protein LDENG_00104220 [Lucifuga dentata]|nr:hypothetical protein LDENG_00104220 [Lucifuga dentata]